MDGFVRKLSPAACLLAVLAFGAQPAFAQGGGTSTSLNGVVSDAQGGVIPGAEVVAKNNATGVEFRAVTDSGGRFTVPALDPGKYTVTVALSGFKTAKLTEIELVTATPMSLKVQLEIGALSETVTVSGATEIVQTRSAAVQTTLTGKQIQALPLVTHTALDFVVALPGVSTTGSNSRGSTIMGLPQVTINITLDGVNVQDNNGRNGDGFFMYIRPMIESIEEITVSTSTPGAESSGMGAAQIRMSTRSGGNLFSGSVYNTWRNQAGTTDGDVLTRKNKPSWFWRLNSPYWFNKRDQPKTAAGDYFIDDVRLQTPGFRVGGPIVPNKAFYFFNWEWFMWPNSVNRTRNLLTPEAQAGLFRYPATDGSTQTVNLLALAAAKGQTATIDPLIGKLLADIRTAAGKQGGIANQDFQIDRLTYSPEGEQFRYFPTVRVDYNVTQNHRLSFSSRYNLFDGVPDILNGQEPVFPGFPNQAGQFSKRFMWQASMRSTLGKNMVNEARIGYQGAFGGGTLFGVGLDESMFSCETDGCQPATWFLNGTAMKGASLGINAANGPAGSINSATVSTGPSSRYTPVYTYEDTLNWVRGKHTWSFGGAYTLTSTENWNDTIVPSIGFGLNANDPANAMLQATSGNFPGGINTTWAGYAQNLYSVLTGRVTSFTGTAFLTNDGRYEYLGDRTSYISQREIGIFASDSWQMKPNVTLTGGLRYEVGLPFQTDGTSFARLTDWQQIYGVSGEAGLFHPGTFTGTAPVLERYPQGEPGNETDWNNVAPSIGVAWRPNVGKGMLATILGTDPVFRGGYSVSYDRYGTGDFPYGGNPGASRAATRTSTSGTPLLGFDGWPVLLRDSARIFPGTFTPTPVYPFSPNVDETIVTSHPNLQTSYTHQWSAGWQRELNRTTALELRYVGNSNVGAWTTNNINGNNNWNILENGFYDEFRKAQQNLRANIADGRGTTFAYTGAPGTAPLPIFLAYFNGVPLSNTTVNGNPASYNNALFSNANWYNQLSMYSPGMTGIAGTGTSGLQNSARAANAAAAGLPSNFFQTNPTVAQASANLRTNGGNTRYQALQAELRRRMSQGLLITGSYVFAFENLDWNQRTLREQPYYIDFSGGNAAAKHALKLNWVYELPFGHGRRFGTGTSSWLNGVIGGWEIDGLARIQSGQKIDIGNNRLVGMDEAELRGMFKLRHETGADGIERIYMLPKEVIEQSIIARSTTSPTTVSGYAGVLPSGKYIAPASGPDCVSYANIACPGTSLSRIITGPKYMKWDMSFVKRITVAKSRSIEARMDLFNIFNTTNFTPVGIGGATYTSWQVTSAARDLNASQDAGGRITSFGLRFNW